jgi:hypothetical protein
VICDAVANYFFEGDDLQKSTRRLREAQKFNLLQLAEMGAGEVQAPPEYETMIDVAKNKFRQTQPVNLDAYLGIEAQALPVAAGAENAAEDPAPKKPARTIKNVLDVSVEDYYELAN